jgi:NDP-sugar pyrophosphorylase family protein
LKIKFLPDDLLDLAETDHALLFSQEEPVWSAISGLAGYLGGRLDRVGPAMQEGMVDPRAVVGDRVYVGPGAVIEANAIVKGPAWIGSGTVVRSGAYVRENVIVGSN